jgi:hypothetical protein
LKAEKLTFEQIHNFFDRPDMLSNLGFHGRRDAERAMNPRKVIVHEIEAHGLLKVFGLLTEAANNGFSII